MAETSESTSQKHTGKELGGETENKCKDVDKEVSSEKSTPVKMYSQPNIFNQSTPIKDASQSEASSQSTPIKEASQTGESSSTSTPLKEASKTGASSSKLKTHDLKHLKEKVDQFCEDMDTQVKACLYSVIKKDIEDSTKSLDRLKRKGQAFQRSMSYSFEKCLKDTAALIQSNATLTSYASMLRREKDGLQLEVDNLKKEKLALQELKDVDYSLLDDSEDDEFSCTATKKAKSEEND